ncbi:hypothetical protein [Stutzerimonas stutzeri]|uniref:hypothetical protein n=1 Tax=Stutzerimonas stutzeri TaxID=316 RepID=UPI0015E35360|nr:hypothetical protein [Stutzerimonas stutzeri]MBA1280202.1 hypothetical protein [Stutzerimonas stutzeri]
MLSNKQLSLSVGAGVALIFLASLPDAMRALNSIEHRQIAANDQLIEWKTSYEALLPVNRSFAKVYPSGDEAKDLVSLYRLVNVEQHRLMADVDLVRQTSATAVEVNGMPIGLQRLCLSNSGDVMALTAESIRDLRVGMRSLSARRDIDMGTIEVTLDDGKAVAKVNDMCVKVRTERDLLTTEEQAWASH